ncbi:hypothetical protein PCCS19_36110 [Paenibacillus sp. CCS19]|nr:hypothetical protein [Paenibacillus cellulosilyticus]GMK40555.1 hypothetical protein PCCS19_36110 [Paenibacillus cellulosilyticus]
MVYNPYCDRVEAGIVERDDQFGKRIRIDGEWILFEDIIALE